MLKRHGKRLQPYRNPFNAQSPMQLQQMRRLCNVLVPWPGTESMVIFRVAPTDKFPTRLLTHPVHLHAFEYLSKTTIKFRNQ